MDTEVVMYNRAYPKSHGHKSSNLQTSEAISLFSNESNIFEISNIFQTFSLLFDKINRFVNLKGLFDSYDDSEGFFYKYCNRLGVVNEEIFQNFF